MLVGYLGHNSKNNSAGTSSRNRLDPKAKGTETRGAQRSASVRRRPGETFGASRTLPEAPCPTPPPTGGQHVVPLPRETLRDQE